MLPRPLLLLCAAWPLVVASTPDDDASYAEARRHYETTAREDGDAEAVRPALASAALALRLDRLDEADEYASAAQRGAAGDANLLGRAFEVRAAIAHARREPELSLSLRERAQEQFLKAGNRRSAAAQLQAIGTLHKDAFGRHAVALKTYDEAATAFEIAGDPAGALGVRIEKANVMIDLGDSAGAIASLETILKATPPGTEAWGRATIKLANARYRRGELEESRALAASVAAREKDLPEAWRTRLTIDAGNQVAMADAALGRLDAAHAEFERQLAIAMGARLPAKEAMLHNNAGFWLRDGGKARAAIEHHEKALDLDMRMRAQDGVAFDLRNLGLAWLAENEDEIAEGYLVEALALSERASTPYNRAHCYAGLGEIALRGDRPDEAVASFKRAASLADVAGDQSLAVTSAFGLGRAYLAQGAPELAVPELLKAEKLLAPLPPHQQRALHAADITTLLEQARAALELP